MISDSRKRAGLRVRARVSDCRPRRLPEVGYLPSRMVVQQ